MVFASFLNCHRIKIDDMKVASNSPEDYGLSLILVTLNHYCLVTSAVTSDIR